MLKHVFANSPYRVLNPTESLSMPRLHRLLAFFVVIFGVTACSCMNNAGPPAASHDALAPFKNIFLHYTDEGQGDVPLIFVHGWGGQRDFWRKETQDLSRDHRVIALDLPGHGASDRISEPYTQQTLAKAVLAVMDRAHVSRAVLVGHSMGGNVVRHVALMAPKRVAGLVLVDGALLFPPHGKKQFSAWMKEMKAFVKQFEGPKGDEFTQNFVDSMHGLTTPEWAKKEVQASVIGTPRDVRVSAMTHFVDFSAVSRKKVIAPTLAVYAKSAEVKPSFEEDLRTLFPNIEFVLWDGPGHFYMLYEDARLDEQIRAFTGRHGF
jgi:pimeloyl-ACP methyl ester carboxylesterase